MYFRSPFPHLVCESHAVTSRSVLPAPPSLSTVLDQVRADAHTDRLSHWGQSTVIDEHTKLASFSREIFDALHSAAGIQATFPVGNAGLIHVYGYWFSAVLTPFGYKFDRWRDGALARALHLPAHAFWIEAPGNSGTTALERVLAALQPALEAPPQAATTADAELTCVSDQQHSRLVIVPSPDTSTAQPSALIYGISETSPIARSCPRFQLITAFPFSGDPHALAAEFVADPRPRWNAVVDS